MSSKLPATAVAAAMAWLARTIPSQTTVPETGIKCRSWLDKSE